MALSYSVDGIRQRNYRVWLLYPEISAWTTISAEIDAIKAYIASYKYLSAYSAVGDFLAGTYSDKLGECRKDSISLTAEDGETVEGNVAGNIVLGKNCSFTCELLNATPDNINQLVANVESQTPTFIILEEVDGRTVVWPTCEAAPSDTVTSNDTHEIIFVGVNNALVLSMAENHVGGGISTATLTGNDTVARVSDFRVILDIPYDLADN